MTPSRGGFPLAGGQCLPPGPAFRKHYRSVRGPGGPLCQRLRRAFGQPVVWRRAGVPDLLRAGPDRAAAAAGGLRRPDAAAESKTVSLYPNHEMLDIIVCDGRAAGIAARNLITGEVKSYKAHAVVLCSGGYGNVFCLSTNAMHSNVTAGWRCHKKGALFANPCFVQIHPTCIPQSAEHQSKLTLMSESLRNEGRIWAPMKKGDRRPPEEIPEAERDYYLERIYPSFGNLVPRDVASRQAKFQMDQGKGAGLGGRAVYLDSGTL